MRVLFSLIVPLGSFAMYWISIHFGSDPYNGTDLLWAALVTIILMIGWYLCFPLRTKIERFSVAWMLGIEIGIVLILIGWIFGVEMGYHWGDYVWFFGLWSTVYSLGFSKKHKCHKLSFFKSLKDD